MVPGPSGKEAAEECGSQRGQGPGAQPGGLHGVAQVTEAAVDGVGDPHAVGVGGHAGAGAGAGHQGALVEGVLCGGGKRQSLLLPCPAPSPAAPTSRPSVRPFLTACSGESR